MSAAPVGQQGEDTGVGSHLRVAADPQSRVGCVKLDDAPGIKPTDVGAAHDQPHVSLDRNDDHNGVCRDSGTPDSLGLPAESPFSRGTLRGVLSGPVPFGLPIPEKHLPVERHAHDHASSQPLRPLQPQPQPAGNHSAFKPGFGPLAHQHGVMDRMEYHVSDNGIAFLRVAKRDLSEVMGNGGFLPALSMTSHGDTGRTIQFTPPPPPPPPPLDGSSFFHPMDPDQLHHLRAGSSLGVGFETPQDNVSSVSSPAMPLPPAPSVPPSAVLHKTGSSRSRAENDSTFEHANSSGSRKSKKAKLDANGRKRFACPKCPKSFDFKSDYERHERVHTNERPFVCPHCGNSFKQMGTLTTHVRTHTGEKPFQCPMCGRRFVQKSSLITHEMTAHPGVLMYQSHLNTQQMAQNSVAAGVHAAAGIHTGTKVVQVIPGSPGTGGRVGVAGVPPSGPAHTMHPSPSHPPPHVHQPPQQPSVYPPHQHPPDVAPFGVPHLHDTAPMEAPPPPPPPPPPSVPESAMFVARSPPLSQQYATSHDIHQSYVAAVSKPAPTLPIPPAPPPLPPAGAELEVASQLQGRTEPRLSGEAQYHTEEVS